MGGEKTGGEKMGGEKTDHLTTTEGSEVNLSSEHTELESAHASRPFPTRPTSVVSRL